MEQMDFIFIISPNRRRCLMYLLGIAALLFYPFSGEGFALAEHERLERMKATIMTLDNMQARISEEERVLKGLAEKQAFANAASEIREGPAEDDSAIEGALGAQLARAQFRASITTGFKYDDNIYKFPNKEKSDLVPRVNSSYDLRLPRGESYLEMHYGQDHTDYLHAETVERNQTFRLTSFYRPSSIFSWELTHAYQRVSDLRVFDNSHSLQSLSNQRKRRTDQHTSTSVLNYMPGGRHNLLHLSLQHEEFSADAQEDESQTDRVDFDFERYINPATSIFIGNTYKVKDERSWGRNDEREQNYFLGFRRDITRLTKLTTTFNHNILNKKSTQENVTSDEFYNQLRFDLYHRISPFTDITGEYILQRQKSISNNYRANRSHEAAFSLNHYFLNGLSARLNPRYTWKIYSEKDSVEDADNESRAKHIYSVSAGLDYRLNDWVNVGVGYTLNSTKSGAYFDDNYTRSQYNIEVRGEF